MIAALLKKQKFYNLGYSRFLDNCLSCPIENPPKIVTPRLF